MYRTTRLAALVAALSITSAGALLAQSTDSTRAPRPRRQLSDSAGGPRRGYPSPIMNGWRGGPGGPGGPSGPGGAGMSRRGFGPPGGFGGGMGAMRGALMRGITLSESQERALRAVRVKQISAMKPLQLEMISARADAQIAQLNGDQKALDAANGRLASTRESVQKLMKERAPMSDLRSVMTPDQQKLLDKNLTDGSQRHASMNGMRGLGGMRSFRGAQQRRGFGPGGPGRMGPSRNSRMGPGMGPRRFGDADDDSGAFRRGDFGDDSFAMGAYANDDEMNDMDEGGDMSDMDDSGWDDMPLPPLPPPPPLPAPNRRP